MKFRDLLSIGYDKRTGVINVNQIYNHLPKTPLEVIEVYSHHGRKSDFQKQYEDLELTSITWNLTTFPAKEIIEATFYPYFMSYFRSVEARPLKFSKRGWQCIDIRKDVIAHWSTHQTWLSPPVFIQGLPPAVGGKLHLMEGHTRVALLRGLVNYGILSNLSHHKILLGHI